MNKKELVEYISKTADITKVQAEKALNSTLAGISESLKKGDKISLIGFGSFSTSRREARTGRNPQTGKSIELPAKTYVKFKVGKTLGDEVNNG
ncbi:MAG: HU family DNA-binding protein [Deltaproteobacteria bacterium]|nr:HU family DNA-binding protein [Deltaproteobacteria bacterium]